MNFMSVEKDEMLLWEEKNLDVGQTDAYFLNRSKQVIRTFQKFKMMQNRLAYI